MKIFFLLFFFSSALLSSCASYNYPSKKITVVKAAGLEKEYGLLSVRGDSAVVVLDWAEAKVKPLPYSHAEVIRKKNIANIIREGKGAVPKTVMGAAVGLGIGAILYTNMINSIKPDDWLIAISKWDAILAFSSALVGGALIGLILDLALNSPTIDLSLSSAKDREFLRSISAYPDKEPEEMQYIK